MNQLDRRLHEHPVLSPPRLQSPGEHASWNSTKWAARRALPRVLEGCDGCPRNDESAGKRRSTRLRHGGQWLKATLVQAAWAAIKFKGGYLQAQFRRLRARRGPKKAIVAVAASMLTAAWHMLRDGTEWHELGATHFDRADSHKTAHRLIRRLQQMGYAVHAVPA